MEAKIGFSFCIITDNSDTACRRIIKMVESIRTQNIEEHEILVIGGAGNKFSGDIEGLKKIDFDESIKSGWITKKKNDIAKIAKYENLVIMHDYYVLHREWYSGFKKIAIRFEGCDLCLNPVCLMDGRRDYTDWVTYDHPIYGMHGSLNYHDESNIKNQYFSGGYFVVKKAFFLKNSLNENLVANQQEDVEWSLRIRETANIIFNPYSYVKHNKSHRNQTIDFWEKMVL
tara:strand:- start:188 stop:874 length:687 start_codon:yes stop_codon:yes gene_type:complete